MTGIARMRGLLAAVVAACGGGPIGAVLERTDDASAADCPYGGTLVSSGRDHNGDGRLQDSEVSVRTPVCEPAPPSGIVLRLRSEPPGPHCATGGTAVQTGTDANDNGTLEDAEVAHTDYLCRGALVTRVAAEPAGAHCREGGVVFFAGPDRDGDGVLDDAEIASTEYACGDVVARDVAIHSDAEVAALAPIRFITGGLTVQLTALRTVLLPRLERIGGPLAVIDNPQLTRLAMPALQAVDGDVTLRAGGLTAVDFGHLRRIASLDLEMLSLASLAGFAMLDEVLGNVRITGMSKLVALELPQATGAGDLAISANAALVHLAWDVSDHLGRIDITGNPRLETVDLSMNTFFGGPVQVGAIAVTSNPMLGHLAVRARQADSFAIGAQPRLTDIQLEIGDFAGDVTVVDIASPFSLGLLGTFGRTDVRGNVTISGPAVSLEPGSGITVGGRFVLDGTMLPRIGFSSNPNSLWVHSLRVSNNTRLTDLSAFALTGDLEVTNNAALTTVNLEHIFGDELGGIVLRDNPMLATAPTLAFLTRVHGAVDVERNPQLGALFGPDLLRLEGPVRVHDNAALADLAFPKLQLVGDTLEISSNAALQTLVLPALPEVAGALTISGNAQLHHLDLASLGQAEDFHVDDNPRLPTCEVLVIFDHTSGAHEQSGNDDTAICE